MIVFSLPLNGEPMYVRKSVKGIEACQIRIPCYDLELIAALGGSLCLIGVLRITPDNDVIFSLGVSLRVVSWRLAIISL